MKKNRFKQIYIEITTCCNLHCSFCPNDQVDKKIMAYNDFVYILKDVYAYTDLITLHVQGEPLLHPDFDKIIKLCSEYQIDVNLTTNGVLVDKLLDIIQKYQNFRKINISLQAITNFPINNQKGYLDKIKNFVEKRPLTIPVNIRLWNDKTNIENQKNNFLIKQYFIDDANNHHFTNLRISEDDEFTWPSLELPDNPILSNCLGGKEQLGILVDGRVILCCLDYTGATNIGSIYESTLAEILNSTKYQKIIKGFNDRKPYLPVCQKCTYRNRFIK